jgi:DNA-binding NtrC family response regulator
VNEVDQKTVLIIENDFNVRSALAEMVRTMGHQTLEIDRATRATRILAEQSVDAMLLDLHMPGPHGQDLLRYLKKKSIAIPPTIVVSGYLKQEGIGELIRLGVCGIIAKPFEAKRLRDELGRVLEGREGRLFFCPQCGTSTREADRFCRQCGTSLERQKSCPRCQTLYGPGDRFCGECGAKLAG